MAWSEILSFDCDAYAQKLKELAPAELKQREVRRTRQIFAASGKIGGGVGLAPFTGGVSLVSSALGGRQMWIAAKKLELVQAELKSRGIELYEPKKKDALIPMGINLATMGLGAGFSDLAMHATSEASANVVSTGGFGVTHALLQTPGSFVHALGSGIDCQLQEIHILLSSGY